MAATWWATGERRVGLTLVSHLVRAALGEQLGPGPPISVDLQTPWSIPHVRRSRSDDRSRSRWTSSRLS